MLGVHDNGENSEANKKAEKLRGQKKLVMVITQKNLEYLERGLEEACCDYRILLKTLNEALDDARVSSKQAEENLRVFESMKKRVPKKKVKMAQRSRLKSV